MWIQLQRRMSLLAAWKSYTHSNYLAIHYTTIDAADMKHKPVINRGYVKLSVGWEDFFLHVH